METSSTEVASGDDQGIGRAAGVLPLIKTVEPWAYATGAGVLYVSGFLVVNANLAAAGVTDFEFANPRYFIAGATFAVFMLFFYLFAGRSVVLGKKWLSAALHRSATAGASGKWGAIIFVHSNVMLLFDCCFSTAAFSALAFGLNESTAFYVALIVPFIVLYTLDVTNLDLKHPNLKLLIELVSYSFAIYVFFRASSDSAAITAIFGIYLGWVLLLNLVMDKFERYRTTSDLVAFTAIFLVTVVLGSAVAYGATVYGHVRAGVGGARPQPVTLGLSEDAQKALAAVYGASGPRLEGNLIHQSASHIYVQTGERTMRIRSEDALAVLTPRPTGSGSIEAIVKKVVGAADPAKSAASDSKPAAVPAPSESSAATPARAASDPASR